MDTSSIAAWTRKVFRADLGVVCVSTYQRVTEAEALRGGRAAIERALESQARIFTLDPDSRFCSHCGDVRPKHYFNSDASRHDGLDVYCKGCRAELRERFKLANPAREAERRERERERLREKRGSQRRYQSKYQPSVA